MQDSSYIHANNGTLTLLLRSVNTFSVAC